MERVSGHLGGWFLDTYGRMEKTGVFWPRERGTPPEHAGSIPVKLYHWVIRKKQIDLTESHNPPLNETNCCDCLWEWQKHYCATPHYASCGRMLLPIGCTDRETGLDHRVGHCGVLHMTMESMGGSAYLCMGASADVETAQSMYPSITPGHAKTKEGFQRSEVPRSERHTSYV
jgi:hypothetical protein